MLAAFGIPHLPLIFALSSAPSILISYEPIPVVEVIKAYGSLAGPECFGSQAPPGSSCQLPLSYLENELGLDNDATKSLTREEFITKLDNLAFQWPLKPYGVEKSLSKTAVMNKGAETAVYMDELERRGLYDRRNPTGPLPTSLRPKLNAQMDQEGIDTDAATAVFTVFSLGTDKITAQGLTEVFQGKGVLDYYDFLNLIGKDSISWPY